MTRRDLLALALGCTFGSVLALAWAVCHPYDEDAVR